MPQEMPGHPHEPPRCLSNGALPARGPSRPSSRDWCPIACLLRKPLRPALFHFKPGRQELRCQAVGAGLAWGPSRTHTREEAAATEGAGRRPQTRCSQEGGKYVMRTADGSKLPAPGRTPWHSWDTRESTRRGPLVGGQGSCTEAAWAVPGSPCRPASHPRLLTGEQDPQAEPWGPTPARRPQRGH